MYATEQFAPVESGRARPAGSAFISDAMPRRGEELLQKFPEESRLPETAR